nr:DegT/DnrJ/EryC1/StrS family aminotransferase [Prolixibacteraceae bacterium]
GDGGAVFTSDEKLAAKIKMLRSHGQEKRYVHKRIGINGRMDTIQAAILRVKLKHFEEEIITRQMAALKYSQLLDNKVMLPEVSDKNISVWAQYTIGVENRDEVQQKLKEIGIPTTVHYPIILPLQEAFADVVPLNDKFEVAQLLSESVLSLPMHGFITNEEVEEVANVIIQIVNGH